MTTRGAVIAEALSWRKTPYHHRARVKGAGVDCAQILIAVYSAVGLIDDFEPQAYPLDWMMHRDDDRFRDAVRARADEIALSEVRPGDAALYRVGKCYAHGAIVISWPAIIHADSRFGAVTLADGDQGWLAARPVEFYRVRGIRE